MTQDVMRMLGSLEGMAFIAKMDAQTLRVGCDRKDYFTDVARYNETNIRELYALVRELTEVLENEHFTNIELHPF